MQRLTIVGFTPTRMTHPPRRAVNGVIWLLSKVAGEKLCSKECRRQVGSLVTHSADERIGDN